jgi:hypothetical protein
MPPISQYALDDVQALMNETASSDAQFFPQNLQKLFDLIDEEPALKAVMKQIEAKADFEAWYSGQGKDEGSAYGSLKWPRNRDQALGIQISLFRAMAEERVDPTDFASTFISTSPRYDDMIAELSQQVFSPMADGLMRRFIREASETEHVAVPAADRTVSLTDNQPAFTELAAALDKLETELAGSNVFHDPDDKAQRVAEISAGKRLLQSPRARLGALFATLGVALNYLAKTFFETGVGDAASWAWEKLVAFIPAIVTFFSGA